MGAGRRLRWAALTLAAYVGLALALERARVAPGLGAAAAWSGGSLFLAAAAAALATAGLSQTAGVAAYAIEIAARGLAAALLGGLALAGGDAWVPGFPPRGDEFLLAFLGAYLVSLTVETVAAVRDSGAGPSGASGER